MKLLNPKYLIATLTFICTLSIQKAKAQVNTQDSLALVDLYDSTGGPNWYNHTNWLTKEPVSSWWGVTVSGGRVVKVVLNQDSLKGTIPSSIGTIGKLTDLEMWGNQLSGNIPSSIGNLYLLNTLRLYYNQLTGSIPNSFGNLSNLVFLGLYNNQLTGSIPASFINLLNLGYLYLNNNQLTGIIPNYISTLTNLLYIQLNNNQFSGTIPSSIVNLTKLRNLNLAYNQLNGSIPSSIGNLITLQGINFSHNFLNGSVPASMGNLTNLTILWLSNNNLTFDGMQKIAQLYSFSYYSPQSIVSLVNISNTLSVSVGGTPSNNTFKWYKDGALIATKVGDSTFTPTSNGKYWVVATNSVATKLTLYSDTVTISGNVNTQQDSLALVDFYNSTNGANWKDNTNWLTTAPLSTWKGIVLDSSGRVSEINLYVNNLTGTLPNSIGNLTHLTSISLHINAIGGDIPASIGKLTNLTSLDLGENSFTGKIPDSLASLTKLTQLDLSDNFLTGSIPSWIGSFTKLKDLWLQYNNLSDSIPSSIGNLTGLEYLVLQNNQLSGAIPASFGNLTNLKGLFLQNNKFTFDGMELIAKKFPFAQYAPQDPIPLDHIILLGGGQTILIARVGGTPAKEVYNWYNRAGLVTTIYKTSYYEPSVEGYYYVLVTDSLVPGLELHSDTIKVDVVVPIKSISLQAKEANGKVVLQWNTINEINTASFTIQHSRNGVAFTDVSSKSALGKGDNSYSLMDELPFNGINYYRIKVIDKDGAVSYSKVVSVQLTIDNYQLSITPNPSKDKIIIRGNHIASVQVMDNTGRIIKTYTQKDATNPTLSVGTLPAGVYHFRVQTTDGKVSSLGFVKE